MPILMIQQQQTEVGRIRLGVQVPKANGNGTRPEKLDRLRFTSPRKALIDEIARLYGGKVEPWQPPKGSQQWQVIVDTNEVPVVVPPQDPGENQWYEMWSKGGCLRRCDGQQEKISKSACLCDPEARDCKMHTRLRVMLRDVPGLGAWRVDTGSYYAAVELPGVASLLAMAQGAIPARLVLDQRTVTRNGKTHNFAVPTLHVDDLTPGQFLSGRVQEIVAARASAAVDGQLRAAIGATPSTVDYPSLIEAAKTVEALFDLHRQAKDAHGGDVPADLFALFEARANAIRNATPQATQPAPARPAQVVEATVVERPADPQPPVDDLEALWLQILEASPWDDTDELEREFIKVTGTNSADAGADHMRKFLAAIEQVKASH